MTLTPEEFSTVFYKPTWPPWEHHDKKQRLTKHQLEINKTCRNILVIIVTGLVILYILYRYG
jgi:hypothetical protein